MHTFICLSLHSVFFYSHLNIKTRLNTFLQTKVYLVQFLRTFLSLTARFDTLEIYKYLNEFAESEISMNRKQIYIKIEDYLLIKCFSLYPTFNAFSKFTAGYLSFRLDKFL